MDETMVKKSSPVLIGAAWLLVLVPTAWGLTFTVQSALKIFSKAGPSTSAPAGSPAPVPAPTQK